MPKRLRSVWVTMKEIPMFGLNLAGYGSDREGVVAEITAAEEMFSRHFGSPLRVDIDLAQTEMMPEIVAFLNALSGPAGDPIFKIAIIGIPSWKKTWYQLTKKVRWPKKACFFDEHEKAKAWLISERF